MRLSTPALWYFVRYAYKLYERREIPKKSGGKRVLHIPDTRLAWAQRRLLGAFLNRVEYPPWVSAYIPGRAPIDAAKLHAGRSALIILDLKDFFPSTKRAWVRDAVQAEFGVNRTVAELLATLCTAPLIPGVNEKFAVPQGAPTSGAVANIVAMHRLDPLVLEICERYGMDYTRYADDLAFSRDVETDRETVALFIGEIIRAIQASGYRVNYDKIRVQRPHQQQRLLGMTINERPNLPDKTFRRLRTLVHQATTQGYNNTASKWGFESGDALDSYIEGMLAYAAALAPERVAALRQKRLGRVLATV